MILKLEKNLTKIKLIIINQIGMEVCISLIIFFLLILDIVLSKKNMPKIKIVEAMNIKKLLLNKPKNKKG